MSLPPIDLEIRTDRPTDVLFAACGTFAQATICRSSHAAARRPDGALFEVVLRDRGMGRTSIALAPSNQDVV